MFLSQITLAAQAAPPGFSALLADPAFLHPAMITLLLASGNMLRMNAAQNRFWGLFRLAGMVRRLKKRLKPRNLQAAPGRREISHASALFNHILATVLAVVLLALAGTAFALVISIGELSAIFLPLALLGVDVLFFIYIVKTYKRLHTEKMQRREEARKNSQIQ